MYEIQHGDHPSRSERSGLEVCRGDRDQGGGQGLSGQLLGEVHSISRAATSAVALSQGEDGPGLSEPGIQIKRPLPPPRAGSGHAGSSLPPTPLGFRPFCSLPRNLPSPAPNASIKSPLFCQSADQMHSLFFFKISNSICVLFSYNNNLYNNLYAFKSVVNRSSRVSVTSKSLYTCLKIIHIY